MTQDEKLFNKFHDNMFTRNGPNSCTQNCRKDRLCEVFYSNYNRNYACTKSAKGVFPKVPDSGVAKTVTNLLTLVFLVTMALTI